MKTCWYYYSECTKSTLFSLFFLKLRMPVDPNWYRVTKLLHHNGYSMRRIAFHFLSDTSDALPTRGLQLTSHQYWQILRTNTAPLRLPITAESHNRKTRQKTSKLHEQVHARSNNCGRLG